jgi:RNA polymerase sigma-70 factor (ECF subfamily)
MQESFRDLYIAHFDYVWAALRRLGVRESDAQDIAQKVFLVAYRKLAEFENRAAIRTWLFRIAVNAASDYRRSAPIRREVATEPADIDFLSGEASKEDLAEQSDRRKRLAVAEAVLHKLPEAQRVVFVLFELEDLPGSEIAALLGISLGTVRSRLRLARQTFEREAKRVSARDEAGRKAL